MIKTKKEMILVNIIGFVSSGVSYIFTILMLMSFAETNLEKILYFLCGVINDGVKWFSLITLIKYFRSKLYKNFIFYCFLFVLFFCMSLIASISFSVYTVKKQMYEVTIVKNDAYINTNEQVEKLKNNIITIENEKTNEVDRINKELDGLPLDYITRREQLSNKKIELTNFYDTKIENLKLELDNKIIEIENINIKEQEIKTLKNNAIAEFFLTISNVVNTDIDNIILIFAIALGIILDTASVALTFDSSFSYQNKRSFNKDMNKYKTIKILNKEMKDKSEEFKDEVYKKTKINTFEEFVKYIKKYDLDIRNIKPSDFEDVEISKSTLYKYKGMAIDKLKSMDSIM